MYFQDVEIPATNRFLKCEHCERLKKMINTGDIEACHNLITEEYEKLQYDKVFIRKSVSSDICIFNVSEFLTTYSKIRIGEG